MTARPRNGSPAPTRRRGEPLALTLCAAAALVALAPGCNNGSSARTTTGPDGKPRIAINELVPASRTPVADLPVPLNFTLNEELSRNYETAGARYVDHTYEGKADKIDVDRFYRRQMPVKGWTLRDASMLRGVYLLSYERNNEKCDIRISDTGGTFSTRTAVTAAIRTVGRGEPR